MKLNKKLRKKMDREYRIRARLWILRDRLWCKQRRNDWTTLLALDLTMSSNRMLYLSNDYSTTTSTSSQAGMWDELVRTFEQIKKQENPFHVPFIPQSNQPIFVIQMHDEIRMDLTKVVNPEELVTQLYILMQPSSFVGISE